MKHIESRVASILSRDALNITCVKCQGVYRHATFGGWWRKRRRDVIVDCWHALRFWHHQTQTTNPSTQPTKDQTELLLRPKSTTPLSFCSTWTP